MRFLILTDKHHQDYQPYVVAGYVDGDGNVYAYKSDPGSGKTDGYYYCFYSYSTQDIPLGKYVPTGESKQVYFGSVNPSNLRTVQVVSHEATGQKWFVWQSPSEGYQSLAPYSASTENAVLNTQNYWEGRLAVGYKVQYKDGIAEPVPGVAYNRTEQHVFYNTTWDLPEVQIPDSGAGQYTYEQLGVTTAMTAAYGEVIEDIYVPFEAYNVHMGDKDIEYVWDIRQCSCISGPQFLFTDGTHSYTAVFHDDEYTDGGGTVYVSQYGS